MQHKWDSFFTDDDNDDDDDEDAFIEKQERERKKMLIQWSQWKKETESKKENVSTTINYTNAIIQWNSFFFISLSIPKW